MVRWSISRWQQSPALGRIALLAGVCLISVAALGKDQVIVRAVETGDQAATGRN
jgi:hypothetical protein